MSSQIITKYTEDVTKKANYPISYRVSYTNYAATTFVKTATPFTISVQDPCDAPVSVTPSVLTNQEYILTDLDTAPYIVPVYTADPSWCAIIYTYTVTDPSGDQIITFNSDPTVRSFVFSSAGLADLALSGSVSTVYTI